MKITAKIALFVLKRTLSFIKKRPELVDKIDSLIPGTLDDRVLRYLLDKLG